MAAALATLVLATSGPAQAATPAEVDALQSGKCAPYHVLRKKHAYTSKEISAAKNGDFTIIGRAAHLVPPVDWTQDPYHDVTWRTVLQSLSWMDPLFYAWRAPGGGPHDVAALSQARDLGLDWIGAHPSPKPGNAWPPKVTGDRVSYLAYLARNAACKGLLSDSQAATFIDSLQTHGDFLADPANHPPSNFGLSVDLGLGLLAQQAPFLPDAPQWASLANQRFPETALARSNEKEGVWLEQSPAYQQLAIRLIVRYIQYIGAPALKPLLHHLRAGLRWFTAPNGSLVQFGDTTTGANPRPVPKPKRTLLHVMWHSGYAFVRRKHSYLAIASSFHNGTHKHADELSFDLYDHGHQVVSDTGRSSYNSNLLRAFTRSSRAHSVLTADGVSFPIDAADDPSLPYGSGIEAAGGGDGWKAVQGINPLLHRQGVSHHRLFLYKPGVALLVLDMVRSRTTHIYRRYFQLGPDIDLRRGKPNRRVNLAASGFAGFLRTDQPPLSAKKGQLGPYAGWTFPKPDEPVPRWTIDYRTRDRSANYLAEIGLNGAKTPRADVLGANPQRAAILLRGNQDSELRVSKHGRVLRVHVGAFPRRRGH